MIISAMLFVRVVPADKDRGYVLLAGWDAKVVQSTCTQSTTLSVITRASLTEAIERLRKSCSCATVRDVTAPALQRKLQKLFGEPVTKEE